MVPLPYLGLFFNGLIDHRPPKRDLGLFKSCLKLGNKLKRVNFEIESTTICKIRTIFKAKEYKFFFLRVLMSWKIMQYFSNLRPY